MQAGLGFYPTGEPLNIQSVRNISARQDIDNFTDYLLFLVRRCQCDGVAGFKMTIDQLFDLTRLGVLEPFGDIKLVHSVRRDLLAQAISHFKARETGKWVSQTKSEAPVEVPYEGADIIRCLHAVTQRRGHYDYYRTLHRVPGINVFYEDVLDDPAAAVTRVGEFLGHSVDTGAVNIDAVKIKQQRDRVNRELRAQFVADFSVGNR